MDPRIPKGVIFTPSGTRGIVGDADGLTPSFLMPLGMAYCSWLRATVGRTPSIIIGRDTRPSGPMIEAGMVHAALATGCAVSLAGACPTPAILHAKKAGGHDGAIIISASHNPAEYNGLKFLSPAPPGTFLSHGELDGIRSFLDQPGTVHVARWTEPGSLQPVDANTPYLDAISRFLAPALPPGEAGLDVVVDTGAGTGNVSTVPFLEQAGCTVRVINEHMLPTPPFFPRNSEPVAENLQLLSETVVERSAAIGMGIDCDGDRISLCDERGEILREDIGLGLVMKNFASIVGAGKQLVIVTNVASSLMFEEIAAATGGKVVRTPIGERYLAEAMNELSTGSGGASLAIVGGEGSCGGIMVPDVNLARDATLAAGCIVAIMRARELPLSALVAELPVFHLKKVKIDVTGVDPRALMERFAARHDPGTSERVQDDVKFSGDGWWVLVHPSNTEPIVRILAEARDEARAGALLDQARSNLEALF